MFVGSLFIWWYRPLCNIPVGYFCPFKTVAAAIEKLWFWLSDHMTAYFDLGSVLGFYSILSNQKQKTSKKEESPGNAGNAHTASGISFFVNLGGGRHLL